jgi:hypothetical protein
MGEDDEGRWEGRLLLVLHDDIESVEFPNLVGEDVGAQKNGIENGDEQIEKQNVGHQQVARHQERVEPASRPANNSP